MAGDIYQLLALLNVAPYQAGLEELSREFKGTLLSNVGF
jgi:hypothetical protein